MAKQIRRENKINLNAWYYAVMSWSLSDPRMQSLPKPNPVDVMPDTFINSQAMARAEEIRQLRRNGVKADVSPLVTGKFPDSVCPFKFLVSTVCMNIRSAS